MTAHDDFWAGVHDALDARRDPLDDPRVRRAIETEPALADRLARLEVALARAPHARPSFRRPGARRAAAAAAIAFALGIAWLALARNRPETAGDHSEPRPAAGRVLSWRMTVSSWTPTGTTTSSTGDDAPAVATRHQRFAPATDHPILAWEITVR